MDRVVIGRRYAEQPLWKRYLGVPLIYVPVLVTVPFVLLGVILVQIHLRLVGAMQIKSYWEFVPAWVSHRYTYSNQIVYSTETAKLHFRAFRWYWIFNCKLYCPMSVALFRYAAYLVMIVENWWCPFTHEHKKEYFPGAIDQSYWHIHHLEREKLHPEDLNNPLCNDETDQEETSKDK